jgi:fumarate reductase subunit D
MASRRRLDVMKRHVGLLGTLYLIWGALGLVVALAILALGLAALALISSPATGESGAALAGSFISALFLTLSVLTSLWGAIHILVALALHRGREWARAFGIVLGIFNLFVPPFGTALGVYALWVLTRDDARALFAPLP